MDFQLTAQQHQLQELTRQFARQEIAPFAEKWDQEKIFPVDTLRKAAQLGLAGIYIKEDIGGSALSRLDGVIAIEQLARACPSTAAYLSIQNMVAWLIDNYANDEQRKRWLPQIISMEKMTSYCLTEPCSGSDAAAMKTTARKVGNEYILNGSKAFISGGPTSDLYVVMARTGNTDAKEISCFVVEKGTPGLSAGKNENKMGWNSQTTSMIFFEDCHIPAENLINQHGEGFKMALSALNGGRINIAACSLGGASECLSLARNYSNERKQFGKSLANLQSIQFKLADMFTDLEAARLLTYRAAVSIDNQQQQLIPTHCAMAKRVATDVGFMICNEAMQIYGGYGYLKDYPIERYFRDLRVHQILEGTNEIMRLIISKEMSKLTI